MNLSNVLRILRTWWWVVGLVLLLTAIGVFWVVSNSRDQYEATATLFLASPALLGDENRPSPSEDNQSSPSEDVNVRLDSDVVVEIADGDAVRLALESMGPNVDYSITQRGDGILRVEAFSDSEAGVVEVADAVIEEIERVTFELDESDVERTGEVTVLSHPQLARERAIESPSGERQIEYFAVGSVFLDIEDRAAEASQGNPYTASSGTLRLIQEVASTSTAREAILGNVDDDAADFEVQFQANSSIPIMYVTATASTPASTLGTVDEVLSFLDRDLADRQAATGASRSTWLEFQRLSVPEMAEPVGVRLGRPIATVLVLGVFAAASLAVLVDSLVSGAFVQRLTRSIDSESSEGRVIEPERDQDSPI